jgi:hypothetical protein
VSEMDESREPMHVKISSDGEAPQPEEMLRIAALISATVAMFAELSHEGRVRLTNMLTELGIDRPKDPLEEIRASALRIFETALPLVIQNMTAPPQPGAVIMPSPIMPSPRPLGDPYRPPGDAPVGLDPAHDSFIDRRLDELAPEVAAFLNAARRKSPATRVHVDRIYGLIKEIEAASEPVDPPDPPVGHGG